jgi:hypothetical protein
MLVTKFKSSGMLHYVNWCVATDFPAQRNFEYFSTNPICFLACLIITMKTLWSSETSVIFYQSIGRNIPRHFHPERTGARNSSVAPYIQLVNLMYVCEILWSVWRLGYGLDNLRFGSRHR